MSGAIESFPPVLGNHPRLLILGSMPGQASLEAGQYYAHPRNLFWPIMGRLAGAGPELPYAQRVERLKGCGIALWDVIGSCRREGSLDTAIRDEEPNDLPALLAENPSIEHVFFNGGKAEQSFRRHFGKIFAGSNPCFCRLPSTSPAYAGLRFEDKLSAWSRILNVQGGSPG